MCFGFLGRRSTPSPPPPPPLRAPTRRPRHPPPPSNFSSSAPSSSSASAPISTDFSSSSLASLVSLRDLLPDGPILYRFDEIRLATDNFSHNDVARSVWRCVLRDTVVVVSERHASDSRRFREALSTAHSLHHTNLAKLLGGCRNGEYSYLVYEFVEGGNLAECLRSKHVIGYSPLSSWRTRIQIAVDVAKGLEYLHHRTSPTFIHRHISSRNILVGNDYRAKIAHVGVSALFGESHQETRGLVNVQTVGGGEIQQEHSSRRLRRPPSLKITGVKGYMPPEYRSTGEITPKYDVFAFGVVLSELLSGKDAATLLAADTLRSVMADPECRGKLRLWMDPLLKDSYPLDDALKVAAIAMSCVDPNPDKRPEMSDVAVKLHRYLVSAEKWEGMMTSQKEILTSTFQPR